MKFFTLFLNEVLYMTYYDYVICSVWVARKPPGYAFIDFDDRRDAQDAIREIDGMFIELYLLIIDVCVHFVMFI